MWYRTGWSFQDSIHYDLYLDKTELMCDSSDGDAKNLHCDKLHGVIFSRAGDPQLEGRGATGFGGGNGSACRYSCQAQRQGQGPSQGIHIGPLGYHISTLGVRWVDCMGSFVVVVNLHLRLLLFFPH